MQSLLFSMANTFMSWVGHVGLLGTETDSNFGEDIVTEYPWLESIVDPILDILKGLLVPLLIIVGTAGSIYAVILGVNFARAETADKREEAKKRMINAIIGLVVMIFLLVILQLFVSNAESIVSWITGFGGDVTPE